MFIYTHPVYPRKAWEKFFKRAFNSLTILNFACWIIVFMDYVSRTNNTFDDYWGTGNFKMYGPLQDVLQNCTFVNDFYMDTYKATVTIDINAAPYHFMTLAATVRAIFILHGVLIGLDFIAKSLFALNIRHFRIRGLHIPINQILLTSILCLSIAVIAVVAQTKEMRSLLVTYVQRCVAQYKLLHAAEYVSKEHDVNTVFGTALDANLWLVVCNLCLYFIALAFLCSQAFTEANAKILMLDYPWEKGIFCKPDKPILVQYTNERKQYEQSIASVDVKEQLKLRSEQAALAYNPTKAKLDGEEALEVVTTTGSAMPQVISVPYPQQTYAPMQQQGAGMNDDEMDEEAVQGDEGGEGQEGRRRRKKKHRRHRSDTEGNNDDGAAQAGEGQPEGERRRHRRKHRSRSGVDESEGGEAVPEEPQEG